METKSQIQSTLSFLILHRLNNFDLWRHFHSPILTITSKQELPLFRKCQYGPAKINTILPNVPEQPIFGKPQIVLDNCLITLVISSSRLFPSKCPEHLENLERMNIIAHEINPISEAYGTRFMMSHIKT